MRKDVKYLQEMLVKNKSLNSKFEKLAQELSGLLYESETFISPAEVERVYKQLIKIKDDPSIGDKVVRGVTGLVDRSKSLFGREKKVVDPHTNLYMLLTAWKKDGMSTRIEDVIDVAEDLGFNRVLVKRAFKQAGIDTETGSDPKVTDFAEKIKNAGLEDYIIKYLQKKHSITESKVFEEVISDEQIKVALKYVAKYHKWQSQKGSSSKVFSKKGKKDSSFDAKTRFSDLYKAQKSLDTFYKKMGILKDSMALASDVYGTPDHNVALQYIKLAVKDLDVPNDFGRQVIDKANRGEELGRIRIKDQVYRNLMDRKYEISKEETVSDEEPVEKVEKPKRAPKKKSDDATKTKETDQEKTNDSSEPKVKSKPKSRKKATTKKATKASTEKTDSEAESKPKSKKKATTTSTKPKMTADTLKGLVDEYVSLDEKGASQTKIKNYFTKVAKKMSEEKIEDAEIFDFLIGSLKDSLVNDEDRNRLLAYIKKHHPRPRNKTKEGKDLLSVLKSAILLEGQTRTFGRKRREYKTFK